MGFHKYGCSSCKRTWFAQKNNGLSKNGFSYCRHCSRQTAKRISGVSDPELYRFWFTGDGEIEVDILTDGDKTPIVRGMKDWQPLRVAPELSSFHVPLVLDADDIPFMEITSEEIRILKKFGINLYDQRRIKDA